MDEWKSICMASSVLIREQEEGLNMGMVVLAEDDDGYQLEESVSSPPTLSGAIAPSGEPTSEAAPLTLSVEPGPAAAVELKHSPLAFSLL